MTFSQERHRERGFTLLEMVVAFAIFLSIFIVALNLFSAGTKLRLRSERRLDIQQNARIAMAYMARQIRMGGYYPENFSGTPPAPLITNPVYIATDAALAVHGDADGSGTSNVFVFCLDGNVLRSLKLAPDAGITCSAGDALASNITSLSFTYYDKSGVTLPNPSTAPYQLDAQAAAGTPQLTTTTQRSAVRRVVISMTARADTIQNGTESYTLTSDVWLRNGS